MQLLKMVIHDPDMDWVSIDDYHVRAHQNSKRAVSNESQEITKSVGGNSYKINLDVDAHGKPLDFLISDGVNHDIKIAPHLLSCLDLSKTEVFSADKGYDCEEFRDLISPSKTHPNIPRKRNNKLGNAHIDWSIYEAMHVVENTFAK